MYVLCFLFSSRRRHTRSYGDWSSDVCSSDLGAIDSHIHMISPQQVYEALSGGTTTMIGGGTGPATGTNATTCTPGAWNLARMMEASDAWPVNFGFLGKGNVSTSGPLEEQVQA